MATPKRTFGLIGFVSLLLLLYVHTQVAILQLSYAIQNKERQVAQLSEEYKLARFQLARLRSPQALSQRLKKMASVLVQPKDQEVIKVLRPKTVVPLQREGIGPAPLQFLTLIRIVKEAQAKSSKG